MSRNVAPSHRALNTRLSNTTDTTMTNQAEANVRAPAASPVAKRIMKKNKKNKVTNKVQQWKQKQTRRPGWNRVETEEEVRRYSTMTLPADVAKRKNKAAVDAEASADAAAAAEAKGKSDEDIQKELMAGLMLETKQIKNKGMGGVKKHIKGLQTEEKRLEFFEELMTKKFFIRNTAMQGIRSVLNWLGIDAGKVKAHVLEQFGNDGGPNKGDLWDAKMIEIQMAEAELTGKIWATYGPAHTDR